MLAAELAWLRGVIDDLREQRLHWTEEWLREIEAAYLPADTEHDEEDR